MDPVGPSDEAPTARGLAAGERVFGRFRLVRRVGQGGMGEVWLARDERLECDVALKFLQERFRWDEAALLALRTETRRTRELNHPGIVRIHDLHEDQGQTAIAMEFLPGGSLHAQRCRRDPPVFTPAEILAWLPQLCAALDHAHAAGVVHRDLKPSNLLLAADGGVKIGDFGIAQPVAESALRISQWAPSGTLAYMGPQQHFGEPPAPSDDVYSLGATLYELLTGKPPFYSGNLAAQIERRVPDSLAERRRQLGLGRLGPPPRVWEETVAACLAKRAEDRPRSAGEVAVRLAAPESAGRRNRAAVLWSDSILRHRPVRLGLLAVGLGVALAVVRSGPEAGVTPRGPAPGSQEQANIAAGTSHPSDATRAWGAWNLDGDGRDASGRGRDFERNRAIPTQDRFGRIDRAIRFNGTAMFLRPDFELGDWTAREPFSVSLWVNLARRAEVGATVVALRSDDQYGPYWSLDVFDSRPRFTVGRVQVDASQEARGSRDLPIGGWSHLAVTYDGSRVRVYQAGRLAGEGEIAPLHPGRPQRSGTLLLAGAHKFDANRFVGSLDDVRVWKRAITADEVARLATDEAPPRFHITRAVYPDTSDLDAAVAREFGANARLADWDEIARWHADDIAAWCDELPLQLDTVSVFVRRGAARFSEGKRHYFINRFQGRKPAYYKVHAELGGMVLALGSWHGVTSQAVAMLPRGEVRRALVPRDGRSDLGFSPLARAVALEWRGDVRPGMAPMSVEFATRDGRILAASVAPGGAAGYLAVSLGDARRPERSHQVIASYGDLRLQVVVRDGRLLFRAVTTVGEAVVFQEELEARVPVPDLVRVTVRGIDSAELTVEE